MSVSKLRMKIGLAARAGAVCVALAISSAAQVQTQTQTTSGAPTKEVKVESGEVVAVKGNDLFVRMPDGSIRDFPDIPASARVTVDGKKLGLSDLKPGMKLQRTTVTTTTPQTVTTIQTVTGKVWHVNPPVSVILTLDNNQNQMFKIPEGQKFIVNGVETDAFALKKGMIVTATKIVETPVTSVTQQTQVTGTMPAKEAVLIAEGEATPAPAAEATTTGGETATGSGAATGTGTTTTQADQSQTSTSRWPLAIGIVIVLLIVAWLGMRFFRKSEV